MKKGTFEYMATQPDLRPGATSPVMDSRDMTEWLNEMDENGWEYVGMGLKFWHNRQHPQTWWIFRKPRTNK